MPITISEQEKLEAVALGMVTAGHQRVNEDWHKNP